MHHKKGNSMKDEWKLKEKERPTYARIAKDEERKVQVRPLELPKFEKAQRFCNND